MIPTSTHRRHLYAIIVATGDNHVRKPGFRSETLAKTGVKSKRKRRRTDGKLWPTMEVEILFKAQRRIAYLAGEPGDEQFAWGRISAKSSASLDAYAVRDRFDQVMNPFQAREFLNDTGLFVRFKGKTAEETAKEISISWDSFKRFQNIVKLSRIQTVAYIYQGLSRDGFDVPTPKPICVEKEITNNELGRPEFFVRLEVETALEAIAATIFIEQQSGIRCRQCKRSACSRIYQIESKHKRQYCSQACARKANKEMKRDEQKKVRGEQ